MHLFVYYKFKPEAYPNIAANARKLVAAIEQTVPGLCAKLLKRPEVSATGEHTWMETYEFDDEHQDLLQSRLTELVAEIGLPSNRHLEWFVEV